MIEQMKIGVSLVLKGEASAKLREFQTIVRRVNSTVDMLQKRLSSINLALNRMNSLVEKLNPLMEKFAKNTIVAKDAFSGLNNSLRTGNTAFSKLNSHLTISSSRMTKTAISASKLKDELEGLVAIGGAVALTSAPMGVMGVMGARSMTHRKKAASGINVASQSFGGLGFTGAAAGALVGLYALDAGYKESNIYKQVMSQVMLQNIPGANEQQIDTFIKSKNIRGVSNIDLLQKLQDAMVVTKNVKESEQLAPYLAKIGYANKAIFQGTKQELSTQDFYDMIKGAELMTGSMDVNVLKPVINEMVKINSATSGQVKPTQTAQLLRASQSVLRGADPKLLYQLEPLIQEFGGGGSQGGARVGSMVKSFYAHVSSGRLTTAAAMQLDKMGLVNKNGIQYNKMGMIKRVMPGSIVDQKLLHKDFIDWYTKYFIGYFKKIGATLQQEELINGIIFTNRDLALANTLAQQQAKIATTASINARAAGAPQLIAQANKLPTGVQASLGASFSKFKQALGDIISPSVTEGMNVLIVFLDKLTEILNRLPRLNFGNIISTEVATRLPGQPIGMVIKFLAPLINDFFSSVGNPASQPGAHVNATGATATKSVIIQVDGRSLMQILLPYFNQSMYHTQIQQSNTFMPGMTPIVNNTGIPYR